MHVFPLFIKEAKPFPSCFYCPPPHVSQPWVSSPLSVVVSSYTKLLIKLLLLCSIMVPQTHRPLKFHPKHPQFQLFKAKTGV